MENAIVVLCQWQSSEGGGPFRRGGTGGWVRSIREVFVGPLWLKPEKKTTKACSRYLNQMSFNVLCFG